MISLEEAQQRVLSLVQPLGIERVPLDDALGRVLAADAVGTRNQPPADNSAMDGYALRLADAQRVAHGPVTLTVAETIPAGGWSDRPLQVGEAARIMTGAPLPPDADLVVMRETTDEGEHEVTVNACGGDRDNIRPAGEDVAVGDVYLPAGRVLQGPDLALLASQGVGRVGVRRRPVVGVIPTGDEVQEVGDPLPPGHIVNGNSHALMAFIREAGGIPRYLGIARDDPATLREVFGSVDGCDAVVTIGGVSVGDFDHVNTVLDELGAERQFWKVAMRPGKPNACGTLGGVPWFGLPGNPVSAMVSFLQYVRPALLCLQGRTELYLPTTWATLEHDLRSRARFLFLNRGVLSVGESGYTVRTTGPQGSGIARSMSDANCLISVPEGIEFVAAGDPVRVQLLPMSSPAQAETGLR